MAPPCMHMCVCVYVEQIGEIEIHKIKISATIMIQKRGKERRKEEKELAHKFPQFWKLFICYFVYRERRRRISRERESGREVRKRRREG